MTSEEKQVKYFLTTVGFYSNQHGIHAGERHSRCVGYFDTFNEAETAALENWGDIYECGYYEYVVIEAIGSGLYQTDFHPSWYKAEWVESSKEHLAGRYSVTKIDPPEFASHICGWGIG